MLRSSIWVQKAERDVFITALLMAEPFELKEPEAQLCVDKLVPTGWKVPAGWYGHIKAAAGGILHHAMVDREKGLEALRALGGTDQESSSKEFEGRRLVRINGGYIVLNFISYRDRDYTSAARSRRFRDRQAKKAMEEAELANGESVNPHTALGYKRKRMEEICCDELREFINGGGADPAVCQFCGRKRPWTPKE